MSYSSAANVTVTFLYSAIHGTQILLNDALSQWESRINMEIWNQEFLFKNLVKMINYRFHFYFYFYQNWGRHSTLFETGAMHEQPKQFDLKQWTIGSLSWFYLLFKSRGLFKTFSINVIKYCWRDWHSEALVIIVLWYIVQTVQ